MNNRPNILVFICDHLTRDIMGAYGSAWGQTPSMDRIARRGIRMDNIYTTCPLCMPARASFWTGEMPHNTRVRSNGVDTENGPLPESLQTVGDLFRQAGYSPRHFGKKHDFGTLRGFEITEIESVLSDPPPSPQWPENYDTHQDNGTVSQVLNWLDNPGDAPFLTICDLNNPHNICGWIGENNSLSGRVDNIPVDFPLPPLPDNFTCPNFEQLPLPIQYICCSHNRQAQASGWNETNFRYYRAAYSHYTAIADRMIGQILDKLETMSLAENTCILLMADHGDGLGAHQLVTKQVSFYDEMTRVPFILSGPGIEPGACDTVGSLLDLMPTLCGIAGIEAPKYCRGKNLLEVSASNAEQNRYAVCEWHTEWGFTTSPGRMIRTSNYKYIRYLEANGEELYHISDDPGEMANLINHPAHQNELERHRKLLEQYIAETHDDFFQLEVIADNRWRSHKSGYHNHKGPAAPEYYRSQQAGKSG